MSDKGRTISLQLEDIVGMMCDKYCKYPEKYLSRYSDPDDAHEIMLEEQCANCPMNRI